MPVIITFTPLQSPVRTVVRSQGCVLAHRCEDITGVPHRQKLPLGSVRGVTHLDALCLHCGAHYVWVDEHDDRPERGSSGANRSGSTARTAATGGSDASKEKAG